MVLVCGGLLLLFLLQAPLQWSKKKKIVMCVAGAVILFIISAMKEITANGDLINYAAMYETLPFYRYWDLITRWIDGEMKDFAFYAIGKIFADFGLSAHVWMAFVSLVYAAAVAYFAYHHSEQPFMSVLILVVLFYGFTLSGLRQTMAMAFCFIAYHFAAERRLRPFLLLVFVAFFFHSSALIFLPAYWIMGFKLGWKQLAAIGAAFAVAVFFPAVYRSLILDVAWNESLVGYVDSGTTLSWAGYIIQLFIIAFCVFFRSGCGLSREERKWKIDAFINCMVVGLCLQSFTVVVAESFRMSYYYSMCSIAAIPNVIANQEVQENIGWMYLAVGACFVAYLFWSGSYNDLTFFWQVR